ncbi:MAG: hypothetical protein A3I66_00665 [Burkholderiales bacterium RIFCSPLOWO2_02_FULL_57_36]|nr:MAG: hypothetical protein A3I66_00665 [Burkholderiales bacterium RIFCSPLOWO2_02_FULL_57_36]
MDLKEIQELLQKQNDAYGEFTRKNDELIKAKADGKAVSELQATVEKLNNELTKLSGDLTDMAKKTNRPTAGLLADVKGLTPEQIAYKEFVNNFLRTGEKSGGLDLHQKAYGTKKYNSSSVPDGGIFVTAEMDVELLRVVGQTSAIGRLARNVTIGTDTFKKRVKTGGMAARRVRNGRSGGNSDTPTWDVLEFTAHTAEAEPQVENETLDDADYALELDLSNEAAIAFAELAAYEYAVGDGVQGARGLLAYDTVANANYAWGKIGYVKSRGASDFAASNPGDALIDLQHALKAQYRTGAAWLMNDSTLGKVRQMKDGTGAFYLWQPDPLAGFGGRLLGSTVEIDDNMPGVAANSLSIAYGDIGKAYVVVNRSGTVLIRDNITEKGVTKFNFRRRFGGGVQNFEAVKLLKTAA